MPAVAGNRQRGRGRGKVNPPGTGMLNPPGQGPAKPAAQTQPQRPGGRGRGRGKQGGNGAGPNVAGAALPGPGGRQLAARVAAGAITADQAKRTMGQRQTLKKAYGDDFRSKLQVGGKSFADVNAALKKNPDSSKLAALRKKLLENRKSVLEAARSKGKGGGGEGGE
jgi:hypothetical protein